MSKNIVIIVQNVNNAAGILEGAALDLITLPHPKGIPVVYIQIDGEILELQSVQPRSNGSWFINQNVSSSGSFYMASKLDPRFLCLPFLERAAAKYSPLDQIITTSDVQGCGRLPLSNSSRWRIDEIADVKDLGDDLILFRYNEVKTLKWLRGKVTRTARHFKTVRNSQLAAQNSSFVGSFQSSSQAPQSVINSSLVSSTTSEPDSQYIKTAVQVVSDYLSDSMTNKLLQEFNLSLADLNDLKNHSSKRKTDWEADLEVINLFQ